MRKDQKYRETKMRLLQKLTGMEWLQSGYKNSPEIERHWFKGYHIYSSKEEVVKRFVTGQSISCFGTKTGGEKLYVAFAGGNRFSVKYLTILYDTARMFIQETGVHFCQFRIEKEDRKVKVIESTREELLRAINSYVLMLPFKKEKQKFFQQFTLVYWDWEVIRCTDRAKKKGYPVVEKSLFTDEYLDNLKST
jgi:hypothetical protein